MSVKIFPPSDAPQVKSDLIRHQFVLVVSKKDSEQMLNADPYAIQDLLMDYFGMHILCAEKVMEGDFSAWHVWYDFEEGEFEKLMGDSTKNS